MISIEGIIKQCEDLKVAEVRVESPSYDERVVFLDEIERWESILSQVLGPPVKPAGVKTSQEHFAMTVNFGGVHENQTLFYKESDEGTMIAMFWPWQNNTHVTMKIIMKSENQPGNDG